MPHQTLGLSARNEMSLSTGLGLAADRSAARNKPHLYPIFGGWNCCGLGWTASGSTPQAAYKYWSWGFGKPSGYHIPNHTNSWLP